ncbi:hypothetical protein [Nonomuraea sp. NPDC050786]|uniref:hypothetical protein n=1 Tax=Nonomuraea sp. NPDC050786 TaxID=3154840 RepID=UPI0033D267CB
MAYRVFPSGQVPTAQVLQKYLMDQAVITCQSTARPPTPVPGMLIFELDTLTFRVWVDATDTWTRIAKVGDWDENGVPYAGTSPVSRLIKGKVYSGSIQTTNISATTDTSIAGANVQNLSVVSGRAYRMTVSLDYNRASGTGALDRLEFKAWNGAVGGTQLGGTVRHEMTGTADTSNRNVVLGFIWKAAATETIANLNLSATVTGTSTQWAAELNAAYWCTVEELGLASLISNL